MNKPKLYFKVMRGFGQDDFIPIDDSELEVAVYAQMTGKMAFFGNGSIDGKHISSILPDFHRSCGWNYGHRLNADDWNHIHEKGISKGYSGALEVVKRRIADLMSAGKHDLIGKKELKQIEHARI